jgi:Mg-chelatase subunit ChlD
VISLQATAEVSKPASVALVAVVDKSGSMQGSKMQLVRGTVEFLAEQLAAQDALGLVTYSDQVSTGAIFFASSTDSVLLYCA